MAEDIDPIKLAQDHLEAAMTELGAAEAWLWDQGHELLATRCQDASEIATNILQELSEVRDD